jgi:hypothetical protein
VGKEENRTTALRARENKPTALQAKENEANHRSRNLADEFKIVKPNSAGL